MFFYLKMKVSRYISWNILPFFHTALQGFTPCNAEQSLPGMELKEIEEEKDEKDIGKLVKKSPMRKFVY